MQFTVNERKIKSEDITSLIGDNADYAVTFAFDEEWEGQAKTARFILKNRYVDVILEDDACTIPVEILKQGVLAVGVYAEKITSTICEIPVKPSIKEKAGNVAAPTDDVYAQLLKQMQVLEQGAVSEERISLALSDFMEKDDTLMKKSEFNEQANAYLGEKGITENISNLTSEMYETVEGDDEEIAVITTSSQRATVTNGKVYTPTANAVCMWTALEVSEGEVYKVTFAYYPSTNYWTYIFADDETNVVEYLQKTDGTASAWNALTDYEITVPVGATKLYINSNSTTKIAVKKQGESYSRAKKVNVADFEPIVDVVGSLKGKRAIFIGDSITYLGSDETTPCAWGDYFAQLAELDSYEIYASVGATWRDTASTEYDGEPSNTNTNNNTFGNVLQKLINANPSEPDVIIIMGGTNDSTNLTTDLFDENQYSIVDESITTRRTAVALTDVDKTTFSGAMRYVCETLRTMYPNAQIILCTFIQTATHDYKGNPANVKYKRQTIMDNAVRMSIPCIDMYGESGIYDIFETENGSGKYLYDGVHPTIETRKKMARFIYKKVLQLLS